MSTWTANYGKRVTEEALNLAVADAAGLPIPYTGNPEEKGKRKRTDPLESVKITSSSEVFLHLKPGEMSAFLLKYIPERLNFDIVMNYFSRMSEEINLEGSLFFPPMPEEFGIEEIEAARRYFYDERTAAKRLLRGMEAELGRLHPTKPARTMDEVEQELAGILLWETRSRTALNEICKYEEAKQKRQKQEDWLKKQEGQLPKTPPKAPEKGERERIEDSRSKAEKEKSDLTGKARIIKNNLELFRNTLESLDKPVCPISSNLICSTDKSEARGEIERSVRENEQLYEQYQTDIRKMEAVIQNCIEEKAMEKRMVKAVSGFLAGMLCVSVFSMSAFAEGEEAFDVRDTGSGYAVAGIQGSAIKDGQVVIPDEIDGIPVTQLGAKDKTSTFLGQYGVTRLVIGKNVRGATTTAFYRADDLREIEISPENKGTLAFDSEAGVLRATAGGNGILVKYLSGNERKSYRVPDGTGRIFNMDHAKFDTLDLNQVTSVEHISFADTEIGILAVGNAAVRTSPDILYGALVGEFDTAGSTLYGSDGDALWHGGRLIKVAAGAEFPDGYFDRFDSISPYAFPSIAQYQNLKANLPERLTKDVVFSFYHQNAAVFMVNGEISFCYDHDLGVPTQVGEPVDYSQDIDKEKYEKVKALMYVGVPYDGTGLFKQVFGMEYGEISRNAQAMEHGDAALNAVSCVLYETLDGVSPDEIRGMGYGIFTKEKVEEYLSCLREAAEHYPQYNVTPEFSVNGGILSFHRAGNGYESDGFTVDTVDGTGAEDTSRGYTLSITTPGMTVKETGQKSFQTGTQVVLVSETAPTEISVSYQEPSLKFYRRTSSGVQDVLCSAMKESHKTLASAILVNDLVISKQDITTGKELPGAELILIKDGKEIDRWISGEMPHSIRKPEDGNYVLTEMTAPDGYETAESISFEVKDGSVPGGKVVMYDQPIAKEVSISKQDMTTGRELPGAELTLSKDGRVIEKWISGDAPHIITGLTDGTYVLTEVTAPKGYEIAEKIMFEVVNGEVAGGPVVMKDKAKTATPSEAVPATPSDAAPATPSDAAPSKPESPKKPDRPTAEEKPSKPENPSGGGGHRRITGSSTSGPGVVKPEAVNREVAKPVEPFPAKIPEPEKNYILPKTGDRSAAPAIALVSFLLLIVLTRKKRGKIKDLLSN